MAHPRNDRVILHIDMDAFFASVEQLDDPSLRGKPVLVGGDGPRGVVAAASYEARKFGCHSAQPTAIAKRLCPQAIIVKGNGKRYRELSKQVFAMFHDVSPLVQPLSIDEAFVDVTGSQRLLGDGVTIATALRKRIKDETGLTASIGVAPNKFLAKLASDMDKPDGLTVVPSDDVAGWLAPLAIGRMWGIGPKSAEKLESMGVRTFGDMARMDAEWMEARFGKDGERYARLARGIDDRPVTPDREAKSIGHEQTFGSDLTHPDHVRPVLLDQTEQVARRLRRAGVIASSVSVKIRFGRFQTITRRCTLEAPTDATEVLWEATRGLFDKWAAESFSPVRLIGMQAGALTRGAAPAGLFGEDERQRAREIDATTDAIVERFGKRAIRRGGTLDESSE